MAGNSQIDLLGQGQTSSNSGLGWSGWRVYYMWHAFVLFVDMYACSIGPNCFFNTWAQLFFQHRARTSYFIGVGPHCFSGFGLVFSFQRWARVFFPALGPIVFPALGQYFVSGTGPNCFFDIGPISVLSNTDCRHGPSFLFNAGPVFFFRHWATILFPTLG